MVEKKLTQRVEKLQELQQDKIRVSNWDIDELNLVRFWCMTCPNEKVRNAAVKYLFR